MSGKFSPGGNRSVKPEPGVTELIAHRGFAALFPQNTMAAFSGAYAMGATSFECDVHMSSDGVPVVIHDSTVDATTDGTGTVAGKTLAQLRALDAGTKFDPKFAGARIPTFAEFLEYAKGRALRVYPEIKGYRTQADIAIMLQAVIDAGMEEQTVFQSFNLADLQYVRERNGRVSVGLLANNIANLTAVARLGRSSMLIDYSSLFANAGWINTCRMSGVDVGAWTVNHDSVANDLRKIGVTRVMSDTCVGALNSGRGMPVAVDHNWGDVWLSEVVGGGVVGVAAGKFTATDTNATDAARKRMYFNGRGGDCVRFEVWARAVSGTGRAGFDYNGIGTLVNDVEVDWSDWRKISLRCVIPYTYGPQTMSVFCGTYAGEVGTVEFFDPRFYVESSAFGAAQVIAKGLIGKLIGAAPGVRPTYQNIGIESVSVLNTNEFKVVLSGAKFNPNPNIHVTCTGDTPLQLFAGTWNNVERSFIVKAYNLNGTVCDLNALATAAYFFVKVEG